MYILWKTKIDSEKKKKKGKKQDLRSMVLRAISLFKNKSLHTQKKKGGY